MTIPDLSKLTDAELSRLQGEKPLIISDASSPANMTESRKTIYAELQRRNMAKLRADEARYATA